MERIEGEGYIESYLQKYLRLGDNFVEPPQVELPLNTESVKKEIGVRDIAATTAFQCYSPGVSRMKSRIDDPKAMSVANGTLDAAHHTTRMHANHTFLLIGVSRSTVHDVLHMSPYYNSEQQSQRYVEAKQGNYLVPKNLTERQLKIYLGAADFANGAYFDLLDLIYADIETRVKQMYPETGWQVPKTAERLSQKTKKLAQEVARYVLPIAQKTTLYYTINEISLLRLFRAEEFDNFSSETKFVVARMVEELGSRDPQVYDDLRVPVITNEDQIVDELFISRQKEEFDRDLEGGLSKLLNPEGLRESRKILVKAVRNILGLPESELSEQEALALVSDPKVNKLLADVYEIGMLDPLTNSLRQVSLTFATRLSHTADSQRQRHRRTPGATPSLEALYGQTPDYIVPLVIKDNPKLLRRYSQVMNAMYENVESALDSGIPKEQALLLLPNALTIRLVETGDLFDWIHRWKQRLCYLAQEEICFISIEQVEQVEKEFPELREILLAPCGIREKAEIKPRCPEGERWCGQPVWRWSTEDYEKGRKI